LIKPADISTSMKAWQIESLGPLSVRSPGISLNTLPTPTPGSNEVLIKVEFCGVCHTELDEIEGRAAPGTLPMTPGHQVLGKVVLEGKNCKLNLTGQTVGVAWIYSTCGSCEYCTHGKENLCSQFLACGRDRAGGYAEYMLAKEDYVHKIPSILFGSRVAPLLCAGAVGYRSLRLSKIQNGDRLGLTGFGASGHLVLQMSRFLFPESPVYVFARDIEDRQFAKKLGAYWAGDICDSPPELLNAIIDTTPAWLPVLSALESLAPAGRLVINAIRKEINDQNLLSGLDYARHLWREKVIKTVANVTRADVTELISLAARSKLCPKVTEFPMEQAPQALLAVKSGEISGAVVLKVNN
jgi:propanol-preferring alcohol dehydrogenase